MSSIIKVDQIQLADGSTPTAGDLGLNVSGSLVNVQRNHFASYVATTTTGSWVSAFEVTYTPQAVGNKLLVTCDGLLDVDAGSSYTLGYAALYEGSASNTKTNHIVGISSNSSNSFRGVFVGSALETITSTATQTWGISVYIINSSYTSRLAPQVMSIMFQEIAG
jgi:hypothetical protein